MPAAPAQCRPNGGEQDGRSKGYKIFCTEAKRVMAATGIEHIDLNDSRELQPVMFMDRVHLNARGNQVVAAIVKKVIEERDLLSR